MSDVPTSSDNSQACGPVPARQMPARADRRGPCRKLRRGLRGEARNQPNHAGTLSALSAHRLWARRRAFAVHREALILGWVRATGANTRRHRLMWSLLALVGLFSMHGLSTHGASGPNGDLGSAMTGSAMSDSAGSGAAMSLDAIDHHGPEAPSASDSIGPVTASAPSETTTASGCGCDDPTGHSDGRGHAPGQSMLMALCLALLALVVTWLVRRGAWPLPRATSKGLALLARGVPVPAPLRPPQLAMLGVWRC